METLPHPLGFQYPLTPPFYSLKIQLQLIVIHYSFTSGKFIAASGDTYLRFDKKVSAQDAADRCQSFGAGYSLPDMSQQTHYDVSICKTENCFLVTLVGEDEPMEKC